MERLVCCTHWRLGGDSVPLLFLHCRHHCYGIGVPACSLRNIDFLFPQALRALDVFSVQSAAPVGSTGPGRAALLFAAPPLRARSAARGARPPNFACDTPCCRAKLCPWFGHVTPQALRAPVGLWRKGKPPYQHTLGRPVRGGEKEKNLVEICFSSSNDKSLVRGRIR